MSATTGISDGLEPWSANHTISGTMDDDEATTINTVLIQDLFTVAGAPVQNGLTVIKRILPIQQ